MALFSRDRPVVLDSYGTSRRSGGLIPRWLIILLTGILIGAGGLYYIQQNHLPARLTPAESEALIARANELERERVRLQTALDKITVDARAAATSAASQIESARTQASTAAKERDDARAAAERTQRSVALIEQVLPPDPRGGAVGVRAARIAHASGKLDYNVVLTRSRGDSPLKGVVEFVAAGNRPTGGAQTVTLEPVEATVDAYTHLSGELALPAGFTPRQVTVRVLDRPGGKLLGMRVFNIAA